MDTWLWFCLILTLFPIIFKIVYYIQSGKYDSNKRLNGKTVIITGATAGIGKETAFDFASRGARVIIACRNEIKGERVAEDIIAETGNGEVVVRRVDTSILSSVREFANRILETESELHILVNNAGIGGTNQKQVTSDGLELTMATNHFGHFLLTNMLLGLLKKSAPSRIITVSSIAHKVCSSLVLHDLNYVTRPFPGWLGSYSQSKVCNILFTLELAEKLRGTGVTANSVHPGMVHTGLVWNEGWGILDKVVDFTLWLMVKNAKLGAQPIIHLAVSDEVEVITGKYFVDCKKASTSAVGNDKLLAAKLWDISERTVKLEDSEAHY